MYAETGDTGNVVPLTNFPLLYDTVVGDVRDMVPYP